MNNSAKKHRDKINAVLDNNTFEHQQLAAQKAFDALTGSTRAVVIAAEMQSGKSGVALALACLQRQNLDDQDICDRKQLKDTLYLVTLADTALLDQAKADLTQAPNVVVSNFNHYRTALNINFKSQPPKLIIIDECHYGSAADAVRYGKVFDYLESVNTDCKIAFISATPFGALYAAGSDSILRHSFNTKLVFHKASVHYHGIRQMHRYHQVVKLDRDQRNFCDDSLMRRSFIQQFKEHDGAGWALIRVPNNSAKKSKQLMIANGFNEDQIFIIGQQLADVPEEELTSLNDFKKEFETACLFDDKIIAITVAGFRAGINFGPAMKEKLVATWDSTIANIAAVVQANIGRACGYHHNTSAKHYSNLDAISAYSELLNHLESNDCTDDFESLKKLFEKICERYDVTGFDRGISIRPEKTAVVSRKLDDSQTYTTASFLVVPALLHEASPNFSAYTEDAEILAAIEYIRNEFLRDGLPYPKPKRALRGEEQNWVKAQWVNGVSYDDYSNSMSSAKHRTLQFIQRLENGEPVEFNRIVNPGGGEATENKRLMATIFSIYNVSGQVDQFKRSMHLEDVHEMCDELGCTHDDTVIVLFQRGQHDQAATDTKQAIDSTRLKHHSVFGS
ncbi:hypothetical protein [Dasania marina]|uniref:hypothetical protein n=1 Tax=Dasania marina TaxID=471499 RepID=UPI0003793EED|nr:hypothetical protein [Dasania marina]